MEAGFGDLQPFNRVMRQLLQERTVDRQARPWALRRLASSKRLRSSRRVLPAEKPTDPPERSATAWVGP